MSLEFNKNSYGESVVYTHNFWHKALIEFVKDGGDLNEAANALLALVGVKPGFVTDIGMEDIKSTVYFEGEKETLYRDCVYFNGRKFSLHHEEFELLKRAFEIKERDYDPHLPELNRWAKQFDIPMITVRKLYNMGRIAGGNFDSTWQSPEYCNYMRMVHHLV